VSIIVTKTKESAVHPSWLACLLVFVSAATVRAENWPQWRGPNGDGISTEKGLPAVWSASKNVAWKLPMPGKAGSTPAVWGDRMFLTSARNNDLVLLCVSTDGKPLWERKISKAARLSIKYDEANEASASPATDGKHVYAFVGTGDFVCFDFDGNEKWRFNAQDRYGRFSIFHGIHNSPLLHKDRIYMNLIHTGGHWVIALDKNSGDDVWKVKRPSDAIQESKEAYTTPCLWTTNGETTLVVLGADYATGHQLSDGKEIWRLTDLNPKTKYSGAFRIIASPVASPDLLVVPTARGGMVVAVKPGAKGTIKPGSEFEVWRVGKGAPDVPSPLIHDGLIYLSRENGVLHCLDAKTGQDLYPQPRLHADRYRASPVLAGDKIILTARGGVFHVIRPGRKFEVLAENTLPDVFTASPAVAGGRIYLRGFENLWAISEGGK
jgi:outer membrane protein assembly factor BamB